MLNLIFSAFNQIRSDRTLKNKGKEPSVTACQHITYKGGDPDETEWKKWELMSRWQLSKKGKKNECKTMNTKNKEKKSKKQRQNILVKIKDDGMEYQVEKWHAEIEKYK